MELVVEKFYLGVLTVFGGKEGGEGREGEDGGEGGMIEEEGVQDLGFEGCGVGSDIVL